MTIGRFGYQGEKFGNARRILMLPHPLGEASSLADAFHQCSLGLHHFDVQSVDHDDARRWIRTVQETMDTTGLSDPTGEGTWTVKAANLSTQEKFEFSRAVDELANYFWREFWCPDDEGKR